jgi:enoyl-CoA hydratase/carnithine racemase
MDLIQTEIQGRVLHIVLNRPDKKNALTAAMYVALVEELERGESDPTIRALVLRGNGDSFCAGNDIEDFLQKPWKGEVVPPAERFIRTVADLKKPVVAAVQGSVVGVGATILLHCDLVYASDDAKFVMPFVNLGLVPEAGSTLLLPALIGHRRAAELLLLATPFPGQRAYELGLVNRVVPGGELLATASGAAQTLAEKPAGAIRMSKQMMKKHARTELDQVIREEVLAIAARLDSPETLEAFHAFLEKRKPDFSKFD